MSDLTYRWATRICRPILRISSRPVLLHSHHAAIPGPYILAPNHLSPFDSLLLIAHAPRPIHFLAVDDVRNNPAVRFINSLCNVFYVHRDKNDPTAVRGVLRRLAQGRVVGIYPEGQMRPSAHSALVGGGIRPDIARLAEMAAVPVIPCAVIGASQFHRPSHWFPLARTRYGLNFGAPLHLPSGPDRRATRQHFIHQLNAAYVDLSRELLARMDWQSISDGDYRQARLVNQR